MLFEQGGQECGHRREAELLAPGREICYCEGAGKRTAYHLSMKKKQEEKKRESERVRRGNRKKQMEGGQKVRRRKRERERRGVKVLYGVLNGSCIQAAVISGHPLWCVHLYTCGFHSEYSKKHASSQLITVSVGL